MFKKVLVTGGTGFLGGVVCNHLRSAIWCQNVVGVGSGDYDLRYMDQAMKMLLDHDPDIVVHLAANVGGIGKNMECPADLFYENMMIGLNVIHQSRLYGVEKLVCIGTVCSYPKNTPIPFSEDDLWMGYPNNYPEETNAPYGLAKRMLLVQAQVSRRQHGLNAICLIPTNLYGPGDNFDPVSSHVIPALIKRFEDARRKGKDKVEVWGDGTATRDFLFVHDAARAIVDATDLYDKSEPMNIGSGKEISIKDLAHMIKDLIGFEGEIVFNPTRPGGQPRRRLSIQRARKEIGFEPQVGLQQGLKDTIDWYRMFGAKER